MNPYELLYIIPAKYTEDEVGAIHEKVKAVLTKGGAQIVVENNLGKRKLAYPVSKFKFGHEFLLSFNAEGGAVPEINRELNLTDEVSRHSITHKIAGARGLRPEEKRRPRKEEVAPAPEAPRAPALTEKELEKEIEKILEEPII